MIDGLLAATAADTAEQVRGAATMISITLAVLSAFVTQRAGSLTVQRNDLSKDPRAVRLDLALDCGLALFGSLLLVAASPLFAAAICELTLLRADTALFALFSLFYVGVVLVECWVVSIAWRRGRVLKKTTNQGTLRAAICKADS